MNEDAKARWRKRLDGLAEPPETSDDRILRRALSIPLLSEPIDNSHYARDDLYYNYTRTKSTFSVQAVYRHTGKLKPRQESLGGSDEICP